MSLFSSIFRARDQAMLGSWRRTVHQIERRDKQLRSTTDQELRKQSLSLQYRARSGEDLSNLLCDAFALVREAGRRTLSMQHYPVQLLGGIAMHHGSIAVMQTGEGKTLTATLPVYLAAIAGQGAHLATANDYLAERDAGLMRPVYEALGLSVGVVQASTARPARQAAYCCDVTYSTAKEIGFDFLRDRLFQRRLEGGYAGRIEMMTSDSADDGAMQPVQRGLNFVLVDEADSILIDEARTPLIVSSAPDDIALAKAALYRWSTDVADQFELDNQYKVDETSRQITLTPAGRKLARKLPTPELLHLTPMLDIYEQLEQAIFVNRNYHRDRQYVIRDGEIVIVDEFTGRLAEGRKC